MFSKLLNAKDRCMFITLYIHALYLIIRQGSTAFNFGFPYAILSQAVHWGILQKSLFAEKQMIINLTF